MEKDKLLGIKKHVFVAVTLVALLFLSAGAVLGYWSMGEMREQVSEQFNQEQLVIARHIASLIERRLDFLKKEILLLSRESSFGDSDLQGQNERIQDSFSRILESGVWKIEICDTEKHKTYAYAPHRHWSTEGLSGLKAIPAVESLGRKTVGISRPKMGPSGIDFLLGTPIRTGGPYRVLLFHVNVSWFLTPFLKEIRSGKTGYAWLIDEEGVFLFHPKVDFVGQNAFEVREEKVPGASYGMINFIQKEKMLKGREGTGWYYSGWHRGITGQIKKLIAFYPVSISEQPSQRWSVAVVAPVSEIEAFVHKGYTRHFLLQGLVIVVILLGASAVFFFEKRWSHVLEERVALRTEELKKSEEKYRSLVESAEDFIFTVDAGGRLQSVNSFTANFFGGPSTMLLGKSLSSLFPGEVAGKQLKLIDLVYKYGKSVRDEFDMIIEDHEIWINANFMPLKNDVGEVHAVLCIARDITENKNLERQLINAEKLASLGTLAAGVAHEINNPLGVILGFSDLLLRKADKGSQDYEDLKTIERQGLHCKQVVENLLSFARVGEAHSEYSNLNQCLQEIIKVVTHTLEMNDIELYVDLSEDLPLVRGDSRQLQQVFLNLINNAIAAMEEGGALWIRSYYDKSARRALVRFKDTGMGIKAEDMEHIFEPFFTTKPEGEGTGLGLFVSYGIINKFGGTIDCASYTDGSPLKSRGTCFTVKLVTEGR